MLPYTQFRFCPKCGKNRIEEEKKKCMRCTACGFIYFHNCASAAAVIIDTGAGILLTLRAEDPQKGYYDLPGGFVDYGESLEQALLREVREELNLAIRELRYLASFPNMYTFKEVTYFTTDALFAARSSPLEGFTPNKEIAEIALVRVEEIDLSRIAFESIRNGIKFYRDTLKPKIPE